MTPEPLAQQVADHFLAPISHRLRTARFLDCSRGQGAFWRACAPYFDGGAMDWCEIDEGRNFLEYDGPRVDYIVTNPPWSLLKSKRATKKKDAQPGFIERGFQVAKNVIYLLTANHALGLKARFDIMDGYGFGPREILLLDTPPKITGWPQSGFQLCAMHWQQGYLGPIIRSDGRSAARLATSRRTYAAGRTLQEIPVTLDIATAIGGPPWDCKKCSRSNTAEMHRCIRCGEPRRGVL